MAAKRRKKHKNKISGVVISMCYNEQKSKFRLFTNPSRMDSILCSSFDRINRIFRIFFQACLKKA
jgi:hypothetical protein